MMKLLITVLLFMCSTGVAFLTIEKENELALKFSAESEEYCHPPACHTNVPLSDRLASVKLVNYYRQVGVHMDNIAKAVGVDPESLRLTEGHSMGAAFKVATLSRLADDPRIKNICEIGVNAGHSSLNFLVSNPTATLLSFDIFWHKYTPDTVRSLKDLYPTRKIITVAGSSVESVPDTTTILNDDFKCQLIFIDGGHTAPILDADLTNMHALADPAFHKVIIDDLQLKMMRDVYEEKWIKTNRMVELERHEKIKSNGFVTWSLSADETHFEFSGGSGSAATMFPGEEEIAVAQFVF